MFRACQETVTGRADSLSARTSRFSTLLGCFQPRPAGVYTIDNVTLPALGTDDAMTQTPGGVPQLYKADGTLAQVFPGEQCPASASAAGATGGPATPQPSDATATPQPSRTGGTPQPSGTTATPQPSGTAVAPACLLAATWPQVSFTSYAMPTVLQTQESVQQVNFGAYVFESDYPTATYPRTGGSINWSGGSGLAPSLHVSDPESDRTVNVDTFYSGILFGLAGATGLAEIDQIERWIEDHGEPAGGGATAPVPAGEPQPRLPAPPSSPAPGESPPDNRTRRRPPHYGKHARAASERRRPRILRQIKRWQEFRSARR